MDEFEKFAANGISPFEFHDMYISIMNYARKFSSSTPHLQTKPFNFHGAFHHLDNLAENFRSAQEQLFDAQKKFGETMNKPMERKGRAEIIIYKFRELQSALNAKNEMENVLDVKSATYLDEPFYTFILLQLELFGKKIFDPLAIIEKLENEVYFPDMLIMFQFDSAQLNTVRKKFPHHASLINIVEKLYLGNFPLEEIMIEICEIGDYELFARIVPSVKFDSRLFWKMLYVLERGGNSPARKKIAASILDKLRASH